MHLRMHGRNFRGQHETKWENPHAGSNFEPQIFFLKKEKTGSGEVRTRAGFPHWESSKYLNPAP